MSASRERSPASVTALSTYSSGACATKSAKPTLCSKLRPGLDAWLGPSSVIAGTPIHSDSQVVVVPWYGNVSRDTSMSLYRPRCSASDWS